MRNSMFSRISDPKSGSSNSGADSYRMRCAQNCRSQFPQRYCLIKTSLKSFSSKSRRRNRLTRVLPQLGHAITRRCLYSLMELASEERRALLPFTRRIL